MCVSEQDNKIFTLKITFSLATQEDKIILPDLFLYENNQQLMKNILHTKVNQV